MVNVPPIRRVLADADLVVRDSTDSNRLLMMVQSNPQSRPQLFVYVVDDCLERACQRRQINPREVKNFLGEITKVKIIDSEDVDREILRRETERLESLVEDWDSRIEVAYTITSNINEIVTDRPQDFKKVNLNILSVYELSKWGKRNLTDYFEKRFNWLISYIKKIRFFLFGLIGLSICIAIISPHLLPKPYCPSSSQKYLSCAEKLLLFPKRIKTKKEEATDYFKKKKYREAFNSFQESWKNEGKDPETLIYLNNSLLEANHKDAYTIAVAVPIHGKGVDDERNLAKEILRGVAQAQTSVNRDLFFNELSDYKFSRPLNSIKGKGLRVVIADDGNEGEPAKKIAEALVKLDILGVIGHYASDVTVKVVKIYNDKEIVLISPGSTTENFKDSNSTGNSEDSKASSSPEYFFRTVPSVSVHAKQLVNHIIKQIKEEKVVIFYNEGSNYSKSMYESFEKQVKQKKAKIEITSKFVGSGEDYDFSFSAQNFNVVQSLEELKKKEVKVLVLFPDGETTASYKNAINLIKETNGDYWILGSWSFHKHRTIKEIKDRDNRLFEKFVFYTPWLHSSSTNSEYIKDSQALWGGDVSSRTALAYDATLALIEALRLEDKPRSTDVMERLKSPKFEIQFGATGKIQFSEHGDRRNDIGLLVKCQKDQSDFVFVPVSQNNSLDDSQ